MKIAAHYGQKLQKNIELISVKWSGGNSTNARKEAALFIKHYIEQYFLRDEIGVIAHSHGCNVANILTQIVAPQEVAGAIITKPIDLLIYFSCPVRETPKRSIFRYIWAPSKVLSDFLESRLDCFTPHNYRKLIFLFASNDKIARLGAVGKWKLFATLGVPATIGAITAVTIATGGIAAAPAAAVVSTASSTTPTLATQVIPWIIGFSSNISTATAVASSSGASSTLFSWLVAAGTTVSQNAAVAATTSAVTATAKWYSLTSLGPKLWSLKHWIPTGLSSGESAINIAETAANAHHFHRPESNQSFRNIIGIKVEFDGKGTAHATYESAQFFPQFENTIDTDYFTHGSMNGDFIVNINTRSTQPQVNVFISEKLPDQNDWHETSRSALQREYARSEAVKQRLEALRPGPPASQALPTTQQNTSH